MGKCGMTPEQQIADCKNLLDLGCTAQDMRDLGKPEAAIRAALRAAIEAERGKGT